MMIPSPVLLILGPLTMALITSVLGRWPTAKSVIGAFSMWIFAIALGTTKLNGSTIGDISTLAARQTWSVFGRSLALTEQIQFTVTFIYVVLGFLFLLALAIGQSRSYVSMSLLFLSPMSAALMAQTFVFGAIILLTAFGVLAVLIQGDKAGSVLAALRFLVLATIAMVLLLITDWMVESDQLLYMPTATRLALLAILILLAGFPFHIWIAPMVTESRPLVPIVVLGLAQLMTVVFCLNLLLAMPVVRINAQFLQLLRVSGLLTVVLASLMVLASRTFGRMLGYLLLFDVGTTVLSIAFGSQAALETTLSLIVLRVVSLAVSGVGLGLIRRQRVIGNGEQSDFIVNKGLAWRTPFGIALFAYGGLSLIGLPLTPGFAAHWSVIMLVSRREIWQGVVLLISAAVAIIGLTRCLMPLLKAPDTDHVFRPKESGTQQITAVLVIAVGLIGGLFPQLFLSYAQSLASYF
jgi:formate hydrogenlyase subunit 3/multisubunit Na+/H+ antiporter MnhD subunit